MTECPALDTSQFSVTSDNRSVGAAVNVSCSDFGHRVVGSRSLTCNSSLLWQPALPTCEWTWDFTTHEKVVLGTAVGCAAFIIVVAIVTIITCCCCRRRREEKAYNDLMYGDNPGFVTGPGDSGGVYPDAYFAYQDMGDKHMNGGNPSTMDRAAGLYTASQGRRRSLLSLKLVDTRLLCLCVRLSVCACTCRCV